MLISHEMSHLLLNHSLQKTLYVIYKQWWGGIQIKAKEKLLGAKGLICQFKHGHSYNKFYERKAEILAHELVHRAGYDIMQAIQVYQSNQTQ